MPGASLWLITVDERLFSRLVFVRAPALLLVYATDVAATADALNLLPTDEAANVILLRPYDDAVW